MRVITCELPAVLAIRCERCDAPATRSTSMFTEGRVAACGWREGEIVAFAFCQKCAELAHERAVSLAMMPDGEPQRHEGHKEP